MRIVPHLVSAMTAILLASCAAVDTTAGVERAGAAKRGTRSSTSAPPGCCRFTGARSPADE
jgi:hypothetical protein